MRFRTKFYTFRAINDNYLNNPLPTNNVQITISLDNTQLYSGLLSGLSAGVVSTVSSYSCSITIETGNVLLIEWLTPLNEVHNIHIEALWTDGTHNGPIFYQNFETFGYDIGLNATTNITTGTNADIVLYELIDYTGDWFHNAEINGLTTKILSYREPFTNRVVFYSMTSDYKYHIFGVGGTNTIVTTIDSAYLWTVPINTVFSNANKSGSYVQNTVQNTLSYTLTVTPPLTPIVVNIQVNSVNQGTAKWLPVFTSVRTMNNITNTVTITPTADFTGVTTVTVQGVIRFAFFDLRLTYTIRNENNTIFDTLALNLLIPNPLTFVWDSTPYIYTKELVLYNAFDAQFTVKSFQYPAIVVAINDYEIVPANFQYITKIGANVFRIFNPYKDSTLTYQLQTLGNSGVFINTGNLVTIPPDTNVTLTLVDGIYNVLIDGVNGVIIVDNTIKEGIIQCCINQMRNCGCTDKHNLEDCGQEELLIAITTTYFVYLNLVNELIGTTFLIYQLTPERLQRVTTVDILMKRLMAFVSRIKP